MAVSLLLLASHLWCLGAAATGTGEKELLSTPACAVHTDADIGDGPGRCPAATASEEEAPAGPSQRPCTIARVDGMDARTFWTTYAGRQTVIMTGISNNSAFAAASRLPALVRDYGHREVVLASANTFSHDRRTMAFSEYINNHVVGKTVGPESLANDTWYFFGDHRNSEWAELFDLYAMPAVAIGSRLSFGVGADRSGVPFHFHGPGFSEVFHGHKHWLLYPNDGRMPEFDSGLSAIQWMTQVYPSLREEEKPLECTIGPGEVLYFPNGWYHATLNLGASVFMSTFTDERLHVDTFDSP